MLPRRREKKKERENRDQRGKNVADGEHVRLKMEKIYCIQKLQESLSISEERERLGGNEAGKGR